MSEADRRFARYALPTEAFSKQRIRPKGLAGLFSTTKQCRIKDMSYAGALLMCKAAYDVGTRVDLLLVTRENVSLVFASEIVNLGRELSTGDYKLGVRINAPMPGTKEDSFLNSLERAFKPSK